MKILHISTKDSWGAGTAAFRLHLGLKSIGLESKMLVLQKDSSDRDVVQVEPYWGFIKNLWRNKIGNKAISSEMQAYKNTCSKGLDIFTEDRTKHKISEHPMVRGAGIIHLHWISRMVDYNEFFSNLPHKPIVWTLHDKNPMTGGLPCSRRMRKIPNRLRCMPAAGLDGSR